MSEDLSDLLAFLSSWLVATLVVATIVGVALGLGVAWWAGALGSFGTIGVSGFLLIGMANLIRHVRRTHD